jgi:hypothetical protein
MIFARYRMPNFWRCRAGKLLGLAKKRQIKRQKEGIWPLFRSTLHLNFNRSGSGLILMQQAKCKDSSACTVLSHLSELGDLAQERMFLPICLGHGTRIQQEFLTNPLNPWSSVHPHSTDRLRWNKWSELLFVVLSFVQIEAWFPKLLHELYSTLRRENRTQNLLLPLLLSHKSILRST